MILKIALIGYGAMGKLIERQASERGHEIAVIIDEASSSLSGRELAERLEGVDVAIDFSSATAVRRNVEGCIAARVPLVEGTTGWNSIEKEIADLVKALDGAMVFAANFSIGVNLFYYILGHAAEVFGYCPEYDSFIEEEHHSRKLDRPSGTALEIRRILSENSSKDIPIASTRAGNIPGTHRVGFDGPADQILIQHTARTRDGFATGSLVAAEWIVGKKGFHEFWDVLEGLVAERTAEKARNDFPS